MSTLVLRAFFCKGGCLVWPKSHLAVSLATARLRSTFACLPEGGQQNGSIQVAKLTGQKAGKRRQAGEPRMGLGMSLPPSILLLRGKDTEIPNEVEHGDKSTLLLSVAEWRGRKGQPLGSGKSFGSAGRCLRSADGGCWRCLPHCTCVDIKSTSITSQHVCFPF